ncbi:MAG TPA: extracellular solute-binding protein [Candidatus Hydrogenedentes bacterium]|nr:extracellular solute-binding protein [Candidatus Hydrogenedentota bacterium]
MFAVEEFVPGGPRALRLNTGASNNVAAVRALQKCAVPLALYALLVCMPRSAFAETSDEQGPIVVRFCYWANYVENEFIQRVCDSFERDNPGITIKREWFVGDYGRKMQLVFITGEAADIILMDDEVFPTYSVRGYLEDIRPYIERESDQIERELAAELHYLDTPKAERDPHWRGVFLPTALESFNYRGFQGGLPWDGNVQLIYYNKDLLDEAGLAYPRDDWTWDEFRAMAKKLTKDLNGDGQPDQFGTNLSFGFLGFEAIVWSFGGAILNEDRTRCAMHLPPAVEAARFIYDMKMEDRSIAWSGELEGFLTEVQLLTGRVGLVPAMSYMIPALNRVKDGAMRWGLAHMPFGPTGVRYTRITWDGISIYAHSTPEKKEIAWRLLKYFLKDEHQQFIGETQRGLPVRRKQAEEYYIDPDTPAVEEIVLEATEYARLTPITPRYQELRDAIQSELDRLEFADVSGVTPEEAMANLEPKVNKVLDKELAEWAARETPKEIDPHSLPKAFGIALGIVASVFAATMLIPAARRGFLNQLAEARRLFTSRQGRSAALEGLLFASPWLIGLCLFQAFPILFSIVLSFCEWDPYNPISEMNFVGLENFRRAFSQDPVAGDPLVLKALYNTFYYAIFAVPLGLSLSLGLAILLNQRVRGITIFRTTFYLPSIVAGVATVILWMYILNPTFGPLNAALRHINAFLDWTRVLAFIDLPEPKWLADPQWAKPAMILMALWGAGGAAMLIFLAGLQGVPDQLYEVAELDGAGRLRKFLNITLPMLTPTIYFNLIMGLIGSLKVFMQAYVMTDGKGGIEKSLLFYVLHLYNKAFVEYEMGYASALAWILFVIILALTLLIIRSSAVWVYYEGERKT